MANTNAAYGFHYYAPKGSGEPKVDLVRVKASTTIYPGQPLELADGVYNPVDATTDHVRAIAIGYAVAGASTPVYVLAITNPWDCYWRVQGDSGAFAATDIGKFGIHTTTAADTTTKQARNVITYSTLAAAPGDISDAAQWEIIGKVPETPGLNENIWGAYVDLVVCPVRRPLAA